MKRLVLVILAFFISGCASTRLEETLGSTWRTSAPENAILGAYGIRTVTGDGIIFTQSGRLNKSKLELRASKARTVTYDSVKEVTAEVSKDSVGKLDLSYSDIAHKGYKVVISRLDNTKKIANNLSNEGDGLDEKYLALSSLRFITGTAQIYDHKQTKSVDLSGSANADGLKKFNGKIVLKGAHGEDIELSYADGATVAYTYARICWNSDGSINYLQEETPNPWYLFWTNAFDCADGTFEEKPI